MRHLQICPRDSTQIGIRVHRQSQISPWGDTAPGAQNSGSCGVWSCWWCRGTRGPSLALGKGEQSWVSIQTCSLVHPQPHTMGFPLPHDTVCPRRFTLPFTGRIILTHPTSGVSRRTKMALYNELIGTVSSVKSSIYSKSYHLDLKWEAGFAQGHFQNVAVAALSVRLEGSQPGLGCSRVSCCATAEESQSLPQGLYDGERITAIP